MFTYFRFNLPRAVTEQLMERLGELSPSAFTDEALATLAAFQEKNETKQGVYVIHHEGAAVYAGKADNLFERLSQHLWKLKGRRGINMGSVQFKAVLLDQSWSTSANEGLLIAHYQQKGECKWNGNGFGPKDPGKERDTTTPSWFDSTYPVRDDWPVENIPDDALVRDVLQNVKDQLPFLLRFEKIDKNSAAKVDLKGIPRTARAVLTRCAKALGPHWQLTLLKFGFILYPEIKEFRYGERLYP